MPWLCIHHWTICRLSFRPSGRFFSFHSGVGVHRTLYWPNHRLSLRTFWTKTVVGQKAVYHSGLLGQKLTIVPFPRRIPVSAIASLDKRPSITPGVSAKNLSPSPSSGFGQWPPNRLSLPLPPSNVPALPSIMSSVAVFQSGRTVYHCRLCTLTSLASLGFRT
jgi:hypothetical protein